MRPDHQKVAVATTSPTAADAARETAELGGNAVDCAIAAAMCAINTQPGVCALAGSAYVTIWAPDGSPVTIDGNVAVPGAGLPAGTVPDSESVTLEYGGGVTTLVGASSVAVPGTLKALSLAAARYGTLPWKALMTPSIRATREGFPLAAACHYYLGYAGDVIYGRSEDGHGALHDDEGNLLPAGCRIVVPHLADTLELLADEGDRAFYSGELGRRVVDHVQDRGGLLTMDDLARYTPHVHESLTVNVDGWRIATNPLPAIGGANLAGMLLGFGTGQFRDWDDVTLRRLIATQEATMRFRGDHLDGAVEVDESVAELLELARGGELISRYASGSTVHTSAVDGTGLACAITASSGYGAGEMPPGTGLWLNNCLGELELNLDGLDAGPPGRRLPSNMAPSCARSENAVLAIGSPGADRITTALHQFLINFLQRGLDLSDAVAHPRLHLMIDDDTSRIAVEPGLELPDTGVPVIHYDKLSMFFGGVVAALFDEADGYDVAADPRREGGVYVGPTPH
jgi:gamma-glutamyltranspeptidase/glutathione hydrolase